MSGESVVIRDSPLVIPQILRAHWRTATKEVANFVAEPSTVKSEFARVFSVAQAAEEQKEFVEWNRMTTQRKEAVMADPAKFFIFADFRASETDIGELRLQEMGNGKPYITYKYAMLFEVLSKPEAMGVLFFDEMNLAPNMTKAQFYKVVNDHCIGDIPLSKDVMVISAGNEAQHARGVSEDPIPLVLRRGNYFLRSLTDTEYVDYSIQVGQHSLISGYIKYAPKDVHNIDYDQHEGTGQPCPRTWTKLSNLLLANPDLDDDQVEMHARAFVGQGAAKKFVAYAKMAKKVDIDEILKKPELVRDIKELQTLYAVITGVLERFRVQRVKVSEKVFEVALHMEREELGAFLLRQMKVMAGKTQFRNIAVQSKVFDDLVKHYGKFFNDA